VGPEGIQSKAEWRLLYLWLPIESDCGLRSNHVDTSPALTLRFSRATKMGRLWHCKWVSIDCTAYSKWLRSLALYNKIAKQLLVGSTECHSLGQGERHSQLPVLVLETCEPFKSTNCR